jgi:hypothetical protein
MKKMIKGWFSKSIELPPITFTVPEQETEKVLIMIDELYKCGEANNLARYRLWIYLQSLFPPIREGNWSWDIIKSRKIIITENIE